MPGAIAGLLKAADAALEWCCVALLTATVVLTVVQIIYRYVLNDALSWSEELARWLFVWAVFLGMAVIAGQRRHMRIDFLAGRLSERGRRGFDYFAQIVVASACVAMVVHGWDFSQRVTGTTGALEWPTKYLYMAVPAGAFLTLVYLACQSQFDEAFPWSGMAAVAIGVGIFVVALSAKPLVTIGLSTGWALHIIAIGLMFLDVPIAFCLVLAAYASFARQGELMLLPVSQNLASSTNSFLLLSIPFFILAAQVMNAGGITHHLVRFAELLVGHLRGGLAQVNIVTNTVMAGLSGSSLAVAVGTAKVLVPEMEKRGYDKPFACAVTSSAATIDNLIPPSIGLIIYSAVGMASVGALFAAGIVPGLLMALALMIVVHIQAKRHGYEAGRARASTHDRLIAVRDALPALLVPALIVGGMRAGAFTASEAGAMAVVYALLIGRFAYRRFDWKAVPGILREALHDTVIIILIVAAAAPFGWALGIERIPQKIAEAMGDLAKHPLLFLMVLNVFLLIVGLAMEFIASIVILVPILLPIAVQAGIDPVQLGIIMVMNLVIGALTPPLGVLVFATASIARVNINEVYREVTPFLLALIGVLMVVTYWPGLSLWLPRLIGF
jgi:C4-dicarboxylate transporter DctM subunit